MAIDIQTFSATGAFTWTKPANAKLVRIFLVGGGGGGGSGARNTGIANGGSGGGGAGITFIDVDPATLPASATGSVGTGGTGGPAQGVDNSNGSDGVAGGDTTFDVFTAKWGINGFGGARTSGVVAPGGTGGAGTICGGAGGSAFASASSGGQGFPSGSPIDFGATGSTSPATFSGAQGNGGGAGAGRGSKATGTSNDAVNAAHGADNTNGTDAPSLGTGIPGGGGGGGGFGVIVGGRGGNGALGGGGGGGGSSNNSIVSGAGGQGGNGFARIVTLS
jgi:hypothetical protein